MINKARDYKKLKSVEDKRKIKKNKTKVRVYEKQMINELFLKENVLTFKVLYLSTTLKRYNRAYFCENIYKSIVERICSWIVVSEVRGFLVKNIKKCVRKTKKKIELNKEKQKKTYVY